MIVNKLASTTKGVKRGTDLNIQQVSMIYSQKNHQIFTILLLSQVGAEPTGSDGHPSCDVFYSHESLHSVVITCGPTLFPISTIKNESDVLLDLIAAYYVFSIKYPAAYGILAVLDKYCLNDLSCSGKKKLPTALSAIVKKLKI